MTDVTAPLSELRAAYRAFQNAKRDRKEEITEKYAARIADEVRQAVEAEKYAFAKRLRDVKEAYGLRVTDIQDHVLRTRNWKVWEDLRDYADIEPEQVSRGNAKAAKIEAERPYRWNLTNPEKPTLTWLRNDRGEDLATPIFAPIIKAWRGTFYADEYSREAVKSQFPDPFAFSRMIDAEVKRAYEAGEIGDVLTDFDRSMLENERNNA